MTRRTSRSTNRVRRPSLAVWKFASCDGCQLSLLDLEDELLGLASALHIANFPEASSTLVEGPYDLSLVEGSITTQHDKQRIQQVRNSSRVLVVIGACASAGGIQALKTARNSREFASVVYAHPEYIDTLDDSTPIADHVPVDYELRGCPVDKYQLLELVSAVATGRRPNLPVHSVCVDCKLQGNACLTVTRAEPCLGPVTHSGCRALCPSYDRGCFGCYGPLPGANTTALSAELLQLGLGPKRVNQLYRSFNPRAPAFADEAARHDPANDGAGR